MEDREKLKDLIELREDVEKYYTAKSWGDLDYLSWDIGFKITKWRKDLGPEIIERLKELERRANDFFREEHELREEKLGNIVRFLTEAIDKKIINTAKKLKEVV